MQTPESVSSLYSDSSLHTAYCIPISRRETANHSCLPLQRRLDGLDAISSITHSCLWLRSTFQRTCGWSSESMLILRSPVPTTFVTRLNIGSSVMQCTHEQLLCSVHTICPIGQFHNCNSIRCPQIPVLAPHQLETPYPAKTASPSPFYPIQR